MLGEPAAWDAPDASARCRSSVAHLRAQVEAGVQAVQVFDSWVGRARRRRLRAVTCCRTCAGCSTASADLGVPLIHFGVGTGELLALMRDAGGDGDRRRLARPARRGVGARRARTSAVQGNLDPAALLAPVGGGRGQGARRAAARRRAATGHVFNLGHGVLPGTPPETLQRLVDLVHARPNGLERVTDRPIGVLVMAYGTASGPDDIERYYTDIRGGRAADPRAPRRS